MFVILMGGFYDVRCWNGLRWRDIHTNFHDDRLRYFKNIMVITAKI
jgi:hypothetical protein